MGVEIITIETYVNQYLQIPVVDVRSPNEFNHAHICNAKNIPIFTNEERAIIGTAYKQQSREIAIKIGLDFFGKKMKSIVEQVENFIQLNQFDKHEIIVHCARGGMPSATIAWLLNLYGFKVYQLNGGYKLYRHWVLEQFVKKYTFHLLSGFTGSGKTEILHQLKKETKNIVDLEQIANHKGSSFGGISQPKQPSQEMFENLLANELFYISKRGFPIFIEDESKRIGHVNIPNNLYDEIKKSLVIKLDIPFEQRLNFILTQYGKLNKLDLIEATKRIEKKLGSLLLKETLEHFENNNFYEAFKILLTYYDKLYAKSMMNYLNNIEINIEHTNTNSEEITKLILKKLHELDL